MGIVSVRVNDDEMKVLNEFSKLYGCGGIVNDQMDRL